MISTEVIDKIKQAADIVSVIGDFVTLKKKGANWWGCCPFHNEKTGSFSVNPAKQIYKCFGCGKGGNVFTFIQEHEQLSFPEAVRWLGKKCNIEVPERELTPEEREKEFRMESLQVVMMAAAGQFEKNLTEQRAVDYLQNRGFTIGKDSVLELYCAGYALSGNRLSEELVKKGFSKDILKDTGLIGEGEWGVYDYFRNRIIFPFLNLAGNVIGFTGREIEIHKNGPKYLNTKETELFHKGAAVFGLYQSKKSIGQKDKVYFVEGQFDVLSWVQAGFDNTVCGSGTALTEGQVKMLLRFTRNVTLVYDGDAAGLKAAQKNIKLLVEQGAAVRCVRLPDGEDPDSFVRRIGSKELEKFLKKQEVDFVTFLAQYSENQDPEQKEKALQEIVDLIVLLRTETLQVGYVKTLAKCFDLEQEPIWRAVVKSGKELPPEEEVPDGFYGMEEAVELLRNNSGGCVLTPNWDLFEMYYGQDPAVYCKGMPPREQLQDFQRKIDQVEFGDDYLLRGDVKTESSQLLVLKELFRAGVTVSVTTTDGVLGFAQYYVSKLYGSIIDGVSETMRAVYVDRCAELISFASETVRTVMADTWAKSLGLKITQYKEILKPYVEKRKSKSAINTQRGDMSDMLRDYDPEKTPDYVEENEEYQRVYRRYGFYPGINKEGEPVCYMFKNNSGHIQIADFYMIPLLHIYDQESEYNKRVIKINRLSCKQPLYLEVKSKSLASLQSFEEILLNEEALNFENGELKHFKKIRQAMSYNYTKCSELKIFGQQSENFYAFANAIHHEVDGKFRVDYADDLGVMSHAGENYYTPAYSKIYSGLRKDSDKYEQHRYFIYKDIPVEKQCSFEEWAALMNEVYRINDNGKWAIMYAIMCAFRSDIHVIDRLFTALFFVGPTMSGKTQVAISIRSLYVSPVAPSFNLNSGTDAAFFTLMEGFRDVPQVLEEYNNKDISKDKFQGLKAITYDGDGKQKRKGISDREIDTSKVNSPVVILGQETPEKDDNALMNRVVLCEVPKKPEEYSQRETFIFQQLKDFEKTGLCNILFEILKLRPLVREHYKVMERRVIKDLTDAVAGVDASGDMVRIITTISLFLTMCKLIEVHASHLKLPFTYTEFFQLAKEKVKWQYELISKTDKLSGFFKSIEVMINTGTIKDGRDYAISQPERLTLKAAGGETKQVTLQAATKVLFIRLSNLFALYAKSSFNSENATLSTVEQNLRSNQSYIGVVSSRKFKWMEVREVPKSAADSNTQSMEMIRVMEERVQTTSCIALNYDLFRKYFDIDLERAEPADLSGQLSERPLELEQPL